MLQFSGIPFWKSIFGISFGFITLLSTYWIILETIFSIGNIETNARIIESNTLTYSTPSEKPELILEVKDYNGNEVTSIEGLNYVTVVDGKGNTIKGFDITTTTGKYYITKGLYTYRKGGIVWL